MSDPNGQFYEDLISVLDNIAEATRRVAIALESMLKLKSEDK